MNEFFYDILLIKQLTSFTPKIYHEMLDLLFIDWNSMEIVLALRTQDLH